MIRGIAGLATRCMRAGVAQRQSVRHAVAALLVLAVGALLPWTTQAGAGQPAADSALLVQTDAGVVRGRVGDGVREFRGLPFAAPPIGALRFAPPAAVTPWSDVRDATRFGPACPQVSRFGLTEASDEEDCLHLNVATPLAASRKARPVLVWFYGGAFVGGASNLYALDYLARQGDLVVVSSNYRLGALGFMAHPAFAADSNGGYALEDQRAALRWVQRNIARFGGDPRNVTIAGVSAGAFSVCAHLFTPERTAGLFHRAIIQSAGCTQPLRSVSDATRIGLEVAKLAGCGDPATALTCLRAKSAHDLVAAGMQVAGREPLAFAPSVGTPALPRQGEHALRSGRFVRVPIINGGTRDEMRLYVGYDVAAGLVINPETYGARLQALYGTHAPAVMAQYPAGEYSSAATALGTAMSDYIPAAGLGNCLFLRTAGLAARWVPVYEYEFADRNAPPVIADPGIELGAVHTAELPYQFPRFSNTSRWDGPPLTAPAQQLADDMLAYWASFARTGRPAAAQRPVWRRFKSDRDVLRLEPGTLRMIDAGTEHRCEFWRRLYPQALSR